MKKTFWFDYFVVWVFFQGDEYFISDDVFMHHHSDRKAPLQPPVRKAMAVFSQKRNPNDNHYSRSMHWSICFYPHNKHLFYENNCIVVIFAILWIILLALFCFSFSLEFTFKYLAMVVAQFWSQSYYSFKKHKPIVCIYLRNVLKRIVDSPCRGEGA